MADSSVSIKFIAKDLFSRVSRRLNQSLKRNKKQFRDLDDSMRASGKQMGKTADGMGRNSKRMVASFGSIAKAAGLATAAILAVGKAVKSGFSNSVARERGVEEILQLVPVAGRESSRGLIDKGLKRVRDENNVDLQVATKAVFAQQSGAAPGTSIEDSIAAANRNTAFATATFADPVEFIELSTKMTKVLGTQEELNRTLIGRGANAAQVGVAEFARAFPVLLPALKSSGVSASGAIGLVGGLTKRTKNAESSVTIAERLLSTTTNLDLESDKAGFLAAAGAPIGQEETQAFIRENGVEPLLRIFQTLAKDSFLATKVFNDENALRGARLLDDDLISGIAGFRGQVAFDTANPELSNTTAALKARNSGSTLTAIRAQAALNQSSDALGNAFDSLQKKVLNTVQAGGSALKDGDDEDGTLRKVADFLGGALPEFFGAPQFPTAANPTGAVEVFVRAEPGLSATTGSNGNQVDGGD